MIKKGDKVRCIKALQKKDAINSIPIEEGIYTCREVRNVCVTGEYGILLKEIKNKHHPILKYEFGYLLSRFEKI